MKSECGSARVDQKNCGKNNAETLTYGFNEDTGEETELYGIDLNVHMHDWAPGHDNRVCVMEAIRKATCSEVNLAEFECFMS
jgi:hypothetical protein